MCVCLVRCPSAYFTHSLKTEYSKHVKELYQTGGGLKPEDQQSNLIGASYLHLNGLHLTPLTEKIKGLFPHWDELDGFWRELPNYNPIGVSNASSGANHAAAATSLFLKKRNNDDAGESSGIEDGPGFEVLPGSRGRSASSARSVGDEIDELHSEPEVRNHRILDTASDMILFRGSQL